MEAVEDYPETSAHVKVDIDVLESLLKPKKLEVSLRYVLKHATGRGSNIFQLFDTSEKPNHFVASRIRWLESEGKMVDGKRVGKTSGIKEQWQRPRRAPKGPKKRRCRSNARRQPEKKKATGSWWKRRRGIAFENLSKEMLRYLSNSEDVKVGITELRERVEVPEKSLFLFGKWPCSGRTNMAKQLS